MVVVLLKESAAVLFWYVYIGLVLLSRGNDSGQDKFGLGGKYGFIDAVRRIVFLPFFLKSSCFDGVSVWGLY